MSNNVADVILSSPDLLSKGGEKRVNEIVANNDHNCTEFKQRRKGLGDQLMANTRTGRKTRNVNWQSFIEKLPNTRRQKNLTLKDLK